MAASIWDLSDLCTPWCVHVAATLRIADHIENGIHKVEALAAAAGCDASALDAMLGHLVQKGLFAEPSPGWYEINEPARDLLDPIARSTLNLEGLGGRFAHAWGTTLEFVRTGRSGYAQRFGLPFFEDLKVNPEIGADFDALIGPAGHGTPNPHFDITSGWENVRVVADVGGGTGAMLAEILRAHPHLRGILVDRPKTAARSAETFGAAGVADRVTTYGQSFFDPLPPGADIYMLRGIINDWGDEEAEAILRHCALAAGECGRVVVLKSARPDGTPNDLTIEMVLVGGKHRTVSQFRALAEKAGLAVVQAGQQENYFVVECRPAGSGI